MAITIFKSIINICLYPSWKIHNPNWNHIIYYFTKKYFKPHVQFILSWFGLSLFASLLSNRPYPHYFIQLVPPLSLLLTLIIKNKFLILKTLKSKRPEINVIFLNLFTESFLLVGFIVVMILLNFAPYSTSKYYLNWYKLVTNKINNQEYRQTFDYLMTDNYLAAEIIKASGSKHVYLGYKPHAICPNSDSTNWKIYCFISHKKILMLLEKLLEM